MSSDPKRREELLAHCDQLNEDDGVDPRRWHKPPATRGGQRKTRQLCSQVANALSLILASEFDDEVLLGLTVLAVEPAPNGSQLLVKLHHEGADIADGEVLRRLLQATGFIRAEVAAAITRKRAPQLVFRLI